MTAVSFRAGMPNYAEGFDQGHGHAVFTEGSQDELLSDGMTHSSQPASTTGKHQLVNGPVAASQPVSENKDQDVARAKPRLAERALDWGALCCLIGAGIALLMLPRLKEGHDVMLCLFGTIGAMLLVCYYYFLKD